MTGWLWTRRWPPTGAADTLAVLAGANRYAARGRRAPDDPDARPNLRRLGVASSVPAADGEALGGEFEPWMSWAVGPTIAPRPIKPSDTPNQPLSAQDRAQLLAAPAGCTAAAFDCPLSDSTSGRYSVECRQMDVTARFEDLYPPVLGALSSRRAQRLVRTASCPDSPQRISDRLDRDSGAEDSHSRSATRPAGMQRSRWMAARRGQFVDVVTVADRAEARRVG
jgi:hypothetical protein